MWNRFWKANPPSGSVEAVKEPRGRGPLLEKGPSPPPGFTLSPAKTFVSDGAIRRPNRPARLPVPPQKKKGTVRSMRCLFEQFPRTCSGQEKPRRCRSGAFLVVSGSGDEGDWLPCTAQRNFFRAASPPVEVFAGGGDRGRALFSKSALPRFLFLPLIPSLPPRWRGLP